ncbi:MAG: hypothetical protein QM820_56210 [Minicystis sp.]
MTSRIDNKTRWSLLFVAVGGLGLGLASGMAACVTQPTQLTLSGGAGGEGGSLGGAGGQGGQGGEGGSEPAPSKAKELFADLEPTLYQSCGPMCHEAGGIADMPFLQGPDRYQSIISWPGMIVKDPTTSKLLTYPVAGPQHPYKKLDTAPLSTTLLPKIKAWLAEEAKDIVTTGQPDMVKTIDPFVPIMGFNAIYLAPLGTDLTGMAVTFDAYQIDDNAIELSDIQVHPTGMNGVHVVHPLFVVFPVGKAADPDPVDSFSNVDQTYEAGQSGTLGPGTLVLSNWSPNAKLSLAFQKIELVTADVSDGGTDGGTTTSGCKDVTSFMNNAQGPLKANCTSCHGGGNASAKGAIDMSTIDSDPAKACAQVKNRVSPNDPPSSQLFITTDPGGNAAHPYKFGGSASKFDTFKASVTQWIQAEK